MARPSGHPDMSIQGEPDDQSNTNATPKESKKFFHGQIFQLKLLMLFMLRGLNDDSIKEFQLGTEMPDEGEKFGDLILKFKKNDGRWRYRYVQAKHTQTEVDTSSGKKKTIRNSDLLNTKDGPFSLLMYMQSYLEIKKKITKDPLKPEIHDLVIVTNKDLLEGRQFNIELLGSTDDSILTFDKKKSAHYRITQWPDELNKYLRNPDMFALAQQLIEFGRNRNSTERKDLHKSVAILNKYRCALVDSGKNAVLQKMRSTKEQRTTKYRFTDNFIDCPENERNLSSGAKMLREIIVPQETRGRKKMLREIRFTVGPNSKLFSDLHDSSSKFPKNQTNATINDFFKKLVFAVNTPNENELDDILDSELRKFYRLDYVEFHSAFIFRKMLNWFKKKESQFMSSDEAILWLEEAECKLDWVTKRRMNKTNVKLSN